MRRGQVRRVEGADVQHKAGSAELAALPNRALRTQWFCSRLRINVHLPARTTTHIDVIIHRDCFVSTVGSDGLFWFQGMFEINADKTAAVVVGDNEGVKQA